MNSTGQPVYAADRGTTRTRRGGAPLTWLRVVVAALLAVFGFCSVGAAGVADEVSIQSNLASLYVGKQKVVEGTVTAAQRDGNTVRLHLGSRPQDLTVSLIVTLMSNFPAQPERYYLGKTVRVAGTIGSFRDAPEIAVRDPADIQVVGARGSTPGGTTQDDRPGADAGAEDDAVRQRMDTLADRLHRLEERVQRLEHSGTGSEAR